MNRRSALAFIARVCAAFCSVVIAIPGVAYVVDGLRRRGGNQSTKQRVARLMDLPPNKPVQVAVVGNRKDAWMSYPNETVGRVWLIRRNDDKTPANETKVDAFTATCPHLGCSIQLAANQQFVCPCHKAVFGLDGQQVQAAGHKAPAPRGMDSLECQLIEDPQSKQWWVEVTFQRFQQGSATKQPVT